MSIDGDLRTRLRRVAEKLAAARAMPGEPAMFGASTHDFRLGPPLPEEAVATFERQHSVILPADYRGFVTTVGHGGPGRYGGAGPYYGLHSLDDWAIGLWQMPEADTLAKPFRAEPGRVYNDWLADVGCSDADEPYTGTLALSDQGCGYLAILVVSGTASGRVTDTFDSPNGPAFTSDADFLTWYERWLDAVLAGSTSFQ
jgi:hypothetical protein